MKNLFTFFLCCCFTQAYTQSISNVTFRQEGETVRITYDIKNAQDGQTFDITLYYSTDAGRTYSNALKAVSGDVGEKIIGGYSKTIIWKPMQENITTLESDKVKFKVTATIKSTMPDNMVFVKGGTFQMGSNERDDEKPIHSVTVSDFYIGKYEVTNAEFAAFLNAKGNQEEGGVTWIDLDGSFSTEKCRIEKSGNNFKVESGYENHPVIYVSWYGAKAYCKWLSETTGQNYRLPTEAEWEYAAGGGNQSKGYTYSGSNTINNVAWNYENSRKLGSEHKNYGTNPVGQKLSNELGIYDMSGNVYEWCEDTWHSNYQNAPINGSAWIDEKSNIRLVRGGSWLNFPDLCRVAYRINYIPNSRSNRLGFRVVRH
jgi:formylglycine-generating enzyme required for sulfatase activity